MTIIIGMMADSQQPLDSSAPATSHLLLCADTMATYVTLGGVAITSHQSQGKIYELPQHFFLGFSDDYYWSHLVATEIHGRLLANVDFSKDAVKDLVKAEVREAFAYAYSWYRDEVLRQHLGITIDEYLHDTKLVPDLRQSAKDVLLGIAQDVPAEVIIIGQTHRGPLLLKANAREIREGTEFHVTGAAQESAISWLRFRDQRCNMSVPRSFYHMIEAKRFCQLEPTVGRSTQIVWVPPTGEPRQFQDDGVTTMKQWMDIFGVKDTSQLDSDEFREKFANEAPKAAIAKH
jgi:hypothetical protein